MKRVINLLTLFLLCIPTIWAQTVQKYEEVEIYFDHNKYFINLELRQNREHLSNLSTLIKTLTDDSLTTIQRIEVNSYTSPEGGRRLNETLSINRTNSLYDYMINTLDIPEKLIVKSHSGTDWDGFYKIIEQSDLEYKDDVLNIIKNVPDETWTRVNPTDRWLTLTDSRNKHLMDLRLGKAYHYMFEHIYPLLRRGSVVTIYFERILPPEPEPEPEPEPIVEPEPEPEPEPVEKSAPQYEIKPLFAIKTNLLYDAMTMLNVELEVPIGDRWSIAGEWMFPWWTSCGNSDNSWQSGESSHRNTLEILNGNLEAKYWFGDRTNRPVMTGWHLGLYGGGGKYDLERHAEGYQGEFYVVGLSGGYAHTINKKGNLRMEYSLGFGYMNTDYRYYEEHWGIDDTWHTLRQRTGNYSWFGPTRARVSLVWMLNHKVIKKED